MTTCSGLLLMPCALAVTPTEPCSGLPVAGSRPWQITNSESQTPAQIRPAGEMVASLVFEELKVNVVETPPPAELTAEAETVAVSPAFSESEVGEIVMRETALALTVFLGPPPP